MEPINVLTSIAAPLPLPNIDTDQIIPKAIPKAHRAHRLRRLPLLRPPLHLRHRHQGSPRPSPRNPDFVLNKPEYKGAEILLAEKELRLRLLPRTRRLGHQPVRLPRGDRPHLRRHLLLQRRQKRYHPRPPHRRRRPKLSSNAAPPTPRTRSPSTSPSPNRYRRPRASTPTFEIDPFRKHCLLNGLDDIGLTLLHADALDRLRNQPQQRILVLPPSPQTALISRLLAHRRRPHARLQAPTRAHTSYGA